MRRYGFMFLCLLCLSSCFNKRGVTKKDLKEIDSTTAAYKQIMQMADSMEKNRPPDTLGVRIADIPFTVTTTNLKDYPNGIIPFASIDTPASYLPNLVDKDDIIIRGGNIKIIIDYPLTRPYEFTMSSETGFTRPMLLRAISKQYHQLYDEEEKTATTKTEPLEKRKLLNRNQTNGTYGIWGHDISDLMLDGITVYLTAHGVTVVTLEIDS